MSEKINLICQKPVKGIYCIFLQLNGILKTLSEIGTFKLKLK